MKKKLFMLPCIAVVAIASLGLGKKMGPLHACQNNYLLLQNIEALADGAEEPYPEERAKCITEGGNWNMASTCVDGGVIEVTCTISGEITVCGVSVKGSYSKGGKYVKSWERYSCVASSGNCCTKQGVFVK